MNKSSQITHDNNTKIINQLNNQQNNQQITTQIVDQFNLINPEITHVFGEITKKLIENNALMDTIINTVVI